MATASTIDSTWISSEMVKQIDSERTLAADAKARAESPPSPSLSVLYHEIAAADERHVSALEKIATRYGHTPTRSEAGGVVETLGRIRDRVTGLGSSYMDLLIQDLAAKANAINLRTAWIHGFESLGDAEERTGAVRDRLRGPGPPRCPPRGPEADGGAGRPGRDRRGRGQDCLEPARASDSLIAIDRDPGQPRPPKSADPPRPPDSSPGPPGRVIWGPVMSRHSVLVRVLRRTQWRPLAPGPRTSDPGPELGQHGCTREHVIPPAG